MASVCGRSSPSSRVIDSRRTRACTMADRPKPRIRAHRISQVIELAIARAWSTACQALIAQHQYGGQAAADSRSSCPFPRLRRDGQQLPEAVLDQLVGEAIGEPVEHDPAFLAVAH